MSKSWGHSRFDKAVADRMKSLGNLGEYLAEELLKEAKFKNIKNLNSEKVNFPYADIYAERDGHKYCISVKTRNKKENNGNLNSRYKLGKEWERLSQEAEAEHSAIAAWVTVACDIDNGTFDAFFGLLTDLGGNSGIKMTQEATRDYEQLAFCRRFEKMGISEEAYKLLKNKYKSK